MDEFVTIFHPATGGTAKAPLSALVVWRERGWVRLDDEGNQHAIPADPERPYDPAGHDVEEVVEYLATVDDAEVERVKAVEAAGKNRKGIASWQPDPDPSDVTGETPTTPTTPTPTED